MEKLGGRVRARNMNSEESFNGKTESPDEG